jgi:membrane protease YdiL (CAAX protease family)
MLEEIKASNARDTDRPTVYRPVRFFLLTYALTWIPWAIAAYFSFQSGKEMYGHAFFFLGGFGPSIAAILLIFGSGDQALRRDFLARLLRVRAGTARYFVIAALFFPALSVLSVFVSLFFGQSIKQLTVVGDLVQWLPIMFLAPLCEEIGWRGYGVDALRSKMNVLNTSLVYGVLWGLWHAPLFFINHTYQYEVAQASPLYVLNFFVGIIPVAIMFNWVYYRADRSILAIVLMHFSANVTPETFNIGQYTKLLALPVHIVIAILIVAFNWKLFMERPRNFPAEQEARVEQ